MRNVEQMLRRITNLIHAPVSITVEPKRGEVLITYTLGISGWEGHREKVTADGLAAGLERVLALEEARSKAPPRKQLWVSKSPERVAVFLGDAGAPDSKMGHAANIFGPPDSVTFMLNALRAGAQALDVPIDIEDGQDDEG